MVEASLRLHAVSRGKSRETICRKCILRIDGRSRVSVGISVRNIQYPDPKKNGDEAAYKRDCVDGIGSIETAK